MFRRYDCYAPKAAGLEKVAARFEYRTANTRPSRSLDLPEKEFPTLTPI